MNTESPAHINTGAARTFAFDSALPGVSFLGAVRSELGKLTALRTSWWLSALTIVLGAAMAATAALSFQLYMSEDAGGAGDAMDLAIQGQGGSYFAMFLLGSLGVIAVTTEYSTGAIRSSLTVVPQRSLLFSAKALALLVWAAAVAAMVILVSHLLASLIAEPLSPTDIFDGEIAAMYAATWVTVVLTALLGFGWGVVLRSSAGGIVVLAIILFVVQIVTAILYEITGGAAWVEALLQVEYMNLVDALVNPGAGEPGIVAGLEPWQASVGLLIWVAVPLTLGALRFTRRDA